MSAPRIVLPLAFFLFAAPLSVYAQEGPPVAPGDRVRVTAATIASDRSVGTLAQMSADTCVLKVEGRGAPQKLDRVDRLDL